MVLLAFSALVASVSLTANGLAVPGITDVAPRDGSKVLSLGFNVDRTPAEVPSLKKRDAGVFTSTIGNEVLYYSIDLFLGSNKQKVTVSVDTGSADLWVIGNDCSCDDPKCRDMGSYDGESSSTFKNLSLPYAIEYIDLSRTSGTYVTDDLTIAGGPTIQNFQFAMANHTMNRRGVLGIGLVTEEAPAYYPLEGAKIYPNLPMQLKNQGYINKAAYSLYLNSPESSSGTILFGGIDHAKFLPPLVTRKGFSEKRLGISVDSVSVGGQFFSIPGATIFDSGYSFSTLPKEVHQAIIQEVLIGNNTVNCNPDPNKAITFKVGAAFFRVPLSSLVIDFDGVCYLTITDADPDDFDNLPTFGDNILRHAYVVYDLEENTIGVAQAVYNDFNNVIAIE